MPGCCSRAEHLDSRSKRRSRSGAGESGPDDFQGDDAARLVLLGLVDRAHAALADQIENLVFAEPAAGPWVAAADHGSSSLPHDRC